MAGNPSAVGLARSGAGGPPPVFPVATVVDATNTATVVAAVAAKRIAALGLSVTGESANAALFELKDGAAGTVLWHAFIANTTQPVVVTAPAGGVLFRCSTNTLLQADNSGDGDAYLNIQYVLEDP